jgi:hypothetical protein
MVSARKHRSGFRRGACAFVAAAVVSLGVAAAPASAQQQGLVNVEVTNNTVQVPVAVAANICGVDINVIATNTFGGNAICDATSHATAQGGGGGGGGGGPQSGLVNVDLSGNTVQVPIGVAANVCGVQADVIASNTFGGNALCTSTSRPEATA